MNESLVRAPLQLGKQSRVAFRDAALLALERLGEVPGGRLIIDLSETQRVDSAGLGTLVMLQLRASELRHTVVLRGVSEEIRFLLLMVKLEERFVIEPRK